VTVLIDIDGDRDAVIACVEFGFLAQALGVGFCGIFADRETDSFRAVAPFEVVRAFRMFFFAAVDKHGVRLDAAIRGQYRGTIPKPLLCLHSLSDIALTVHGNPFTVVSV
jgi:hypothetical protein